MLYRWAANPKDLSFSLYVHPTCIGWNESRCGIASVSQVQGGWFLVCLSFDRSGPFSAWRKGCLLPWEWVWGMNVLQLRSRDSSEEWRRVPLKWKWSHRVTQLRPEHVVLALHKTPVCLLTADSNQCSFCLILHNLPALEPARRSLLTICVCHKGNSL